MLAILLAVVVTSFTPLFVPAFDEAAAQPAADRKTQPGSGQCREPSGRKC